MVYGQNIVGRGGDSRNGIALIVVLIPLAIGNSFLFFHIVWPEFSPSDPLGATLYFITGGAHLIYFVIPWFLVDVDGASRSFFLPLSAVVGGLSCAIVISLFLLKYHIHADPIPVAITRANCLHAGGMPKLDDGRLLCDFSKELSNAPK